MAETKIKYIVAVSKAYYRGVQIIETAKGCSFVIQGKTFEFINLGEATACLDAMYYGMSNVVSHAILGE